MKYRRTGILLALSVVNALANDMITLENISVTGMREEEKVIDQPLSIADKDQKEVELDQVVFQKDLLNSLAGVNINQTTSIIGHTTSIRMPMGTGPYYLFMQDGIATQSSGFFNHNGLAYSSFESASSVEVLKGAGTALYGSDAVGGTINVQSPQPSKELERKVKIKGGSDGYGAVQAEISDTIDDTSAYRVSGGYSRSDGWRQHTAYDRYELNLRYDHAINDENSIKTVFSTTSTDAEQAGSLLSLDELENNAESAGDVAGSLDKIDVRRQFDFARLSVEWENFSVEDLDISVLPYIRYNRNRYVATWKNHLPQNDNEITTFGLMQKNSLERDWGRMVFGFDTEMTESDLLYTQEFTVTTTGWAPTTYPAGTIYDYSVDYFAIAPYLHTDLKLSQQWTIGAGLRYDHNSFDYTNNVATGEYAATGYYRPADRKDSFNHLSPKLTVSYRPQEKLNVYARYANAFRIPQASTLYHLTTENQAFTLDPETSDTFEVGVKKEYAGSYVEMAVYYMTIDDTITSYTDGVTGLDYYANGETSIHKGVEFTGYSQLNDEFAGKIAYSYSKHLFDNDATYGDNEMASAPNHLANARLFYTPSAVEGLNIMAEWQYVGSYWMDNAHTVKYGGYSIGNLKASYDYTPAISLFAKATNITDERYATSASYGYGKEKYTPGDPRQFYAGLEYRW